MFEIWVRWGNGDTEQVDETDYPDIADSLVNEYKLVYLTAREIWIREG